MYVLYLHLLTCTDTINPASEMTFLSFSLDLYLDLIFKVTLNRDATLTCNINCHFTLLHNQKVTVFASSKEEKDRGN